MNEQIIRQLPPAMRHTMVEAQADLQAAQAKLAGVSAMLGSWLDIPNGYKLASINNVTGECLLIPTPPEETPEELERRAAINAELKKAQELAAEANQADEKEPA